MNKTGKKRGKKVNRRRKKKYIRVMFFRITALLFLLAIVLFILNVSGIGEQLVYGITSRIETAPEEDESSIRVFKNGRIVTASSESFDTDIYDEQEFADMVSDEVSEYAGVCGSDKAVSVLKLQVKKNRIWLKMNYASPEDYRSFLGEDIYTAIVGKSDEDINYDRDLISTEDNERIKAGDTEPIKKLKVISFTEAVKMRVPGRIMYYSEGLTLIDKRTVEVSADAETSGGIVVYK